LFLIPGTVVSSYSTLSSTTPTCAGWTRSVWPGLQVVLAQLAGELDPRVADALELLEEEAEAAEQAGTEMAGVKRSRESAPSSPARKPWR
jgi:hypothetical protein